MKTTILNFSKTFIALLMIAVTTTSCSTDNVEPDFDLGIFGALTGGSTFTMDVNGSPFVADFVSGGAASTDNIMLITATLDDGGGITLTFPNSISAGTYVLDPEDPQFIANFALNENQDTLLTSYFATAGTLTITEHDTANKKIKGTFNLMCTSVDSSGIYELTDGNFDITYLTL